MEISTKPEVDRRAAITARQVEQNPLYPYTADVTKCDGRGTFTCREDATCYTDYDYIGCCSATSCSRRTTCLSYTDSPTTSCESNSGGCVTCTDPALPNCVAITNTWLEGSGAFTYRYCDVSSKEVVSTFGFASALSDVVTTPMTDSDTTPTPSPTAARTATSTTSATRPARPTNISTNAQEPTDHGSSHGLANGAIAAIATVLGVVGFTIVALLIYFLLRRHRKKSNRMSSENHPPTGSLGNKAYDDQSPSHRGRKSTSALALGGNVDMVGHANKGLGVSEASGDTPASPQGKWEDSPFSKQSAFTPSPITPSSSNFTGNTNGNGNGIGGGNASGPGVGVPGIRHVSPSPPELPEDSVHRPGSQTPGVTPTLPERNSDRLELDTQQQISSPAPQHFTPYRPNGNHSLTGDLARAPTSATGYTGSGTALRGSGWLSAEDAMSGGYRESAGSIPAMPSALMPGRGAQDQHPHQE